MALITSILNGGANNHPTTSEEANGLGTDFFTEGVVGTITSTNSVAPMTGGFAVNAQGTPDMTVEVSTGVAYVTATPAGQNSQLLRVKLTANEDVTISANSSGSTKYDWLYLKVDPTAANDPSLAGDDATTLVTSRSTSLSVDDGTPPTYGVALAVITVANGAVSIANSAIRDVRSAAALNIVSATDGWQTGILPAVSSVTANGNRSYTITFGSSVASTLSSGMRLRTTRTVAAPTQCADLEASSSQYFSKANATGFSTGTTWTFKAKIKPESYGTMVIAALDDGSNTIQMYLNSSGQIIVSGIGGGTTDSVTSYQSVALGKWQDVTGSITMGTPTGEIRLDDVVIPSSVSAGAVSTITISGDETFYIGRNGSGNYFDGKIAQVAIFNTIVSDATLKTYSGQTMTGSETGCKGFWSLNGVLTDASASANTLTASGGAVATNADSPFGNNAASSTLDYALVMSVSGSTATVQVPEGCTIPTSGGVTSVAYSVQGNPYGWVSDKGRWGVTSLVLADTNYGAATADTLYNVASFQVNVPVGGFKLVANVSAQNTSGSSNNKGVGAAISTTAGNSAIASTKRTTFINASTEIRGTFATQLDVSLAAATPYYVNIGPVSQAATALYLLGANSASFITAEPAGL